MGGIQLALNRWVSDPFYQTVFRGRVGDFGGACDPFSSVAHHFPAVTTVTTVDILAIPDSVQADLNDWMPEPASFDCIVSSHTLEHLHDPHPVFARWEQALKPGGRMLIIVPDWEMYERKVWPSIGNPDHKTTWVMQRNGNAPHHQRVLMDLPHMTRVVRSTVLNEGFNPHVFADQCLEGTCECGLELVTERLA